MDADGDTIARQRAEKLQVVKRYAAKRLRFFERAYSGKSLRSAATALCLDCMGYMFAEVKRCPIYACPLWEYRPGRGRKCRRRKEDSRKAPGKALVEIQTLDPCQDMGRPV